MKDPNRRPIFEPSVLPVQTLSSKNPHGRTPLEALLMRALGTKDPQRLEKFLATLRDKAVILEKEGYEGLCREIRRKVGST
jgi:hypothetical protein